MLLSSGENIRLRSAPGEVLVFKSSKLHFQEMHLDLKNELGDILLRITFRTGKKKVYFKDRARKSLGDGWGKEQSAGLGFVAGGSATITVHNCSIASGYNRFQILVNGTTAGLFDSRISGSWTNISYINKLISVISPDQARGEGASGPRVGIHTEVPGPSLDVFSYKISELLYEERQALYLEETTSPGIPAPNSNVNSIRSSYLFKNQKYERKNIFAMAISRMMSSQEIPALDSRAISIRPSHFIQNHKYAYISWDDGKEIRLYHLGSGNILQEYAYSESGSYSGALRNLNIVLDPTSSIAAVRHQDDGISIFFQDANDGFIRTLSHASPTGEWQTDPDEVAKAVKGSSIAVIMDDDGPVRYRVYYQDPELRLREHVRSPSSSKWLIGPFNPGVQPMGTPITAELVHGGGVDINVTWRDEEGRVASRGWDESSGWDLPNARPLDARN